MHLVSSIHSAQKKPRLATRMMEYSNSTATDTKLEKMPTFITSHAIDCAQNALRMTQDYSAAISELEERHELTVDEVMSRHNSNIKWDSGAQE